MNPTAMSLSELFLKLLPIFAVFIAALLAFIGWVAKYILGTIDRRIKETRSACDTRAKAVESQIDTVKAQQTALEAKIDSRLITMDQDIKRVGSDVRQCLESLREALFRELKDSRKELMGSVSQINARLDNMINGRGRD
jgi:hypothetical protein